MVVWIKQGVCGDLSREMLHALRVVEQKSPAGYELFVTSIRDGNHSAGSLHYRGDAVDIRRYAVPRDTGPGLAQRFAFTADDLRQWLSPAYDVCDEGDHIHIEYDPKD